MRAPSTLDPFAPPPIPRAPVPWPEPHEPEPRHLPEPRERHPATESRHPHPSVGYGAPDPTPAPATLQPQQQPQRSPPPPVHAGLPPQPAPQPAKSPPPAPAPVAIDAALRGPPRHPADLGVNTLPPARIPPAPHAQPHSTAAPPQSTRQRRAEGRTTGQLVENIPRTMRVAVPATVEVRLAKGQPEELARGLEGGAPVHLHDVVVTRAMSVRLRAPDGGFLIDTASPETQWVDGPGIPDSETFASWRWTIVPQRRGRQRLQLVVSARTIGPDGLAADSALPDQVIEVAVRTNYARTLLKVSGWAAAAAIGAVIQAVLTPGTESVLAYWQRLFSGG